MTSTNALYLMIGAVIAGVIGAGVWAYEDSRRSGVEISVGRNGVAIEQR